MHCQHFFVAASKNRALSSIIVARALSLYYKPKTGYEKLLELINEGWKIQWIVGPPRSGTNTFVNMLAESADVDGCHLRDAFYFHQSRATSAEEHFNSVCGLIANQMEQRERTGVIVIKDMSQPLEENLSQKWMALVTNFTLLIRNPVDTMASLVTALANDMHVKMTPPNIPLIRSKMLFQNTHDPEKTLLKNVIHSLYDLNGSHSNLKLGLFDGAYQILQRINDHINKNTHKNLSVVDYSFAISQPEYIKETVRRANLSLPDTLTKNWTKSVGQNFRRVSSSQFSTQKFPNKHDPRKNLVWEYGALEGPFLLKPAGQRSLTLDKMPPILQTVILGEMFPLYRKILSHPNFIGPLSIKQYEEFAKISTSSSDNIESLMDSTCYSFIKACFPQEKNILYRIRKNNPVNFKIFEAIDRC